MIPLSFSAHDVSAQPVANVVTDAQTVPAVTPSPLPTTPSTQKHQWTIAPNKPVEKAPPANVVITSSDPVPRQNTTTTTVQSSPSQFTVTIPAQHIKSSNTAAAAVASTTPASATSSPNILAALQDKKTTHSKATETKATSNTSTPAPKSIFGSLTKPMSSTPFSSPAKPEAPAAGGDSTKPNPFAAFSFGQNAATAGSTIAAQNKPFALIGSIGKSSDKTDAIIPMATQKPSDDVNATTEKDDEVENYEPTAHFEPVIPLPDLVEVRTGEESETVLFEHRAKLLRYVKELKEWKERGIGNVKVMVCNDDPNKVRLLMRREQVFKLCCNQLLSKETKFNEMPKMKAALSWYGKDFSENVLQDELFIIRFKLPETCKQFHDVILAAQAKMSGAPTQPTAAVIEKPIESKGFGDIFKPKAGSWSCKGCYTSNGAEVLYCACCEEPKDDTVPKKEKPSAIAPAANAPKFSFGNLSAATKPAEPKPATKPPTATKPGFGDQFKPKPGAWSCKGCYTSNTADTLYCACCEEPKDDTVSKKEQSSSIFSSNMGAAVPKFSFGSFGNASATPAVAAAPATAKSDDKPFGSSTFGFSFGTNAAPVTTAPATLESKDFSFVFKSKSPVKPQISAKEGAYEDVSDDDHVEEEENTTYFTPVIPLPDKVEVRTGEEDEEILYSHR